MVKYLIPLGHGSPRRGPQGCIMRPSVAFLNYLCTMKITQQCGWLGVPLIVISAHVAREPACNNGCGPLPSNVWPAVA